VGVAFTIEEGFAKVITPIDDSPAAKAGIMAGDLITRIDDDQIQGLTHYQVGEKLRGPVGTTIRLGLTRSGRDQPIDISIVRDMISLRSIRTRTDAADIGYIRVVQFNESTAEQLKKGIEDIAAQIAPDKLKGYVLDLRNNPGGLQEAAIALADAFLEDGEIVAIRSRGTEEVRRFRAKAGDLAGGKPLIVLINGGSASTAEVVAGALQDHRRATVVGTRSFGKGSVASVIPLGPGKGAIHLATGQYITPSGRVIEAKGLSPEVEVRQDAPDDLKRDAKPNDAKPGDAKPNANPNATKPLPLQSYIPADPKADKALERAYDLLRRGRAEAKVAVPE
jgi:carboxyl-terminal processing protease